MCFLLNEQFVPPDDSDAEIARWKALLLDGEPHEKEQAASRLADLRAETALTECLPSENEVTAQLASAYLWECWFNERGADARRLLDAGTELMSQGRLEAALELFAGLAREYPGWAEPINKQATILFLLGSSLASLRLCRKVVDLKPNHFGAWNGIALCAARLEKWKEALKAARKANRLLPGVQGNLDIIQLAEAKLREEG